MVRKESLANLNKFSATNPPPPKSCKPRGTYLTPILKRFLEKKISYEDPETQKMITGKVKHAVLWRLLLNACQGENQAIKEILDRIDGKNLDVLIDQSTKVTQIVQYGEVNASPSPRV